MSSNTAAWIVASGSGGASSFDDHLVGRVERHREVLAVELVAVRQDGDQVATVGHARQPGGEVALVALREDRALSCSMPIDVQLHVSG